MAEAMAGRNYQGRRADLPRGVFDRKGGVFTLFGAGIISRNHCVQLNFSALSIEEGKI